MPNETLEQEQITQKPSGENSLSNEDRERIGSLIEEIGDRTLFYTDESHQLDLRDRLKSEGSKATDYIFEEIDGGLLDPNQLWKRLSLLEHTATTADSERIGALLNSRVVLNENSRSLKSEVLRLLQKVGTPRNLDQLEAFSQQIPNFYYWNERADLSQGDYLLIKDVVDQIETRTNDTEIKERITGFRERLKSKINELDERAIASLENIRDEERRLFGPFSHGFIDTAPFQEISQRARTMDFSSGSRISEVARILDERAADQAVARNILLEEPFQAESRLETVTRLRDLADKETGLSPDPEDKEDFLRKHYLEYREENPSPYAPTLGIEIEVHRGVVFPKEIPNDQGNREFQDHRRKLEDRYRATEDAGVPRGGDFFWEFAHEPVHNPLTLSREVQALIRGGFIPEDHHRYPMHLTVGGVTLKPDYRDSGGEYWDKVEVEKSAFVFARALEATGWSTTGGRLLKPYLTGSPSWTHSGRSGIYDRASFEMGLNQSKGIEIRTLQLQSLTGLDRTLRSAYLLGAALKAQQESALNEPLAEGTNIETRKNLADTWQTFEQKAIATFMRYGLPNPSKSWEVPETTHRWDSEQKKDVVDTKTKGDFGEFANLLNEAKKDPESIGGQFVSAMRKLIIETRSQIAPLIESQPDKQSPEETKIAA